MNELPHDDPLLKDALEEFRRAPAGAAPVDVLVSLLERQAVARRRPGRGRVWATAAAVAALAAGFWTGRVSVSAPEAPGPDALPIETIAAPPQLPEPPRIPFAAA